MVAVPFPQPDALPAAEAVEHIRDNGGRIHRMRAAPEVICLTSSEELRDWLVARGARLHVSQVQANGLAPGAYRPAAGAAPEFDLWLTGLRVEGSLWEAAG